jgi:hypothetical protein
MLHCTTYATCRVASSACHFASGMHIPDTCEPVSSPPRAPTLPSHRHCHTPFTPNTQRRDLPHMHPLPVPRLSHRCSCGAIRMKPNAANNFTHFKVPSIAHLHAHFAATILLQPATFKSNSQDNCRLLLLPLRINAPASPSCGICELVL